MTTTEYEEKLNSSEFQSIKHNHIDLSDLPELLRYEEVADYFRVSPHTIRRWVRDNKIQRIFVGQQVRFSRYELQRIINEGGVYNEMSSV